MFPADHVIDLKGVANVPHDMRHLLAGGHHTLELVQKAIADAATKHALVDVKLHAPIENPDKVHQAISLSACALHIPAHQIVCVGLNYKDHAKESGLPIPPEPVLFSKVGGILSR